MSHTTNSLAYHPSPPGVDEVDDKTESQKPTVEELTQLIEELKEVGWIWGSALIRPCIALGD